MMSIKIEDMTFGESQFKRGGKVWKASTLYLFAKAKEYPIVDLPLYAIDISILPFEVSNLKDFVFQCKRVNDCSLDYPIILDDFGQIADGWHRLSKAILKGEKIIKAIRLEEMPAYDIWEE
jgi:hypothetical protein